MVHHMKFKIYLIIYFFFQSFFLSSNFLFQGLELLPVILTWEPLAVLHLDVAEVIPIIKSFTLFQSF